MNESTQPYEWYCAHIILWASYMDGNQDDYPIWERVYLVKALDSDEAWTNAEAKGEKEAKVENILEINNRNIKWKYGGVRKVISTIEDSLIEIKLNNSIDILEITWNEFYVSDEENLKKLIEGKPVKITYADLKVNYASKYDVGYFCAHIILWMKDKDGVQKEYPFWENIYIVKARNISEAKKKAERCGIEEAEPDDGLEVNGKPAKWTYGGVKKITNIIDNSIFECEMHEILKDVAEVTWGEFSVPNKATLDKLISGELVSSNYDE
jgi:hypothetical protein